jgi:TolA-binding protein
MSMDLPDCSLADREHRIVSYLAGTLPADEAEAFEAHYFGCDQCWRELQQGLEIRAAMSSKTDSSAPVIPFVAAPAARRPLWRWVPIAAAAGLVLVAGLTMWFRGRSVTPAPETTLATAPAPPTPAPQSAPSPVPATGRAASTSPERGGSTAPAPQPAVTLDELAHVEPPPYIPVALRGPRNEAAVRFDAAMRRYADQDYAAAMPDLRVAISLDSKMPRATFFLAICQLLTDKLDPAIEELQQTIAFGESPYLEEAHFYLAKARLRQGRLSDARAELTRAIEHGGLREREAQQLKTQVEALIRAKGK